MAARNSRLARRRAREARGGRPAAVLLLWAPPPRPAEALHAGYFELDGGLPAYVAGMRARDEAMLPVDRHANAPRRDACYRVWPRGHWHTCTGDFG